MRKTQSKVNRTDGKMKHNRLIPMFLIFLVLMLPFHSASVFAYYGSIRQVNVRGQDNIPNSIRAYGDSLEIELEASMYDNADDFKEVNPDNLIFTINGQGSYEFDSCEAGSNGWYTCKYSGDVRDWNKNRHSINIKLYDETFVELDQTTEHLCVDFKPPVIESINMPSSATNDPLEIIYTLKDKSNEDCPGVCSGLKKAEIKKGENVLFTDTNLSGCSHTNKYNTTPAQMNLEEGKNKICIKAYDNSGKIAEGCQSIFVDYNPPEFHGSVNLTDDQGNVISYSSPRISFANLEIKITESISEVKAKDVIANFSSLYKTKSSYEKRAADKCVEENNTFTCGWYNFKIKGDGQDTANIYFDIADVAGNSFSKQASLDVPFDETPPTLSDVRTENGKYLNVSENKIIAEVSDSVSGMARANIYADLHRVYSTYGFKKKADECLQEEGKWLCYWYDIDTKGLEQGALVPVIIKDVEDDAGNSLQDEVEKELVYDGEKPVIENVTIKPLGTDIDVLREGDVVEIIATITDNVSGVSKDGVSADFSDIYPEQNWTTADSCKLVEGLDTKYNCVWEYSGPLQPDKTIELDVKAKDNAGNTVLEEKAGEVFVAKVENKEVDFWEDTVSTRSATRLNPNFLWMSSGGTLVRTEVGLVPKSSRSYVHAFTINECKGTFFENESYDTYDIFRQYSSKDRSLLYMILNLPGYDKKQIENATKIDIVCQGEIIQARSEKGNVFKPNEKVNISIEVPFLDGLFQEPSVNTVNRIDEGREQVEKINEIVDIIDTLSFLQTICQAYNSIRNIVNNVCILWRSVKTVTTGDATSTNCANIAAKLNKWWYGVKNEEGTNDYGSDNKPNNGEGTQGVKFLGLQSDKKLISLGFWCDLYLCESCGRQWDDMLSSNDATSFLTDDWLSALDKGDGSGQNKWGLGELKASFNPHQSLPVAIFCIPPCLTGIKNTLLRYKQILVNYNVCMNVATVRGEGSSQCEEYKASQTCRWVVGWFWSWIEGAISSFITSTMANWIDSGAKYLMDNAFGCNDVSPDYELICSPESIYAALGLISAYDEIKQSLKNFQDLEASFQDEQDVEEDLETALDGNETAEGVFPYK